MALCGLLSFCFPLSLFTYAGTGFSTYTSPLKVTFFCGFWAISASYSRLSPRQWNAVDLTESRRTVVENRGGTWVTVAVPRVMSMAFRKSGRRVAIEEAMIPTPFSTVLQMMKSVKTYRKSMLCVSCQTYGMRISVAAEALWYSVSSVSHHSNEQRRNGGDRGQ